MLLPGLVATSAVSLSQESTSHLLTILKPWMWTNFHHLVIMGIIHIHNTHQEEEAGAHPRTQLIVGETGKDLILR